ncbi:MAG: anthranilate phosphoribosyltransferase [Actinomycetota bacterium]
MTDFWPSILARLTAGESLTSAETADAMRTIMRGEATPAQMGGFLMALRTKGETVEELEGLASTTLEFAQPVDTPEAVVDTCGTGGDRAGTFNISTIAAIVCAGAGVKVAKHGNRAASSRCGSADLLEALGVRIDLGPPGVERCIAEAGIGFMFAPVFHPAAAHAAVVRRELAVPTTFNFLGPLTNPARPAAQIVGVSDRRMLPLVAEVLARRGTQAMVFRSHDGLDELTTTGPATVVRTADAGSTSTSELDAAELTGLARAGPDDLASGDAERNVSIARDVLGGKGGPKRDVVLVNAAAALMVAARAKDLPGGVQLAATSIDSGAAGDALARWIETSRSMEEDGSG